MPGISFVYHLRNGDQENRNALICVKTSSLPSDRREACKKLARPHEGVQEPRNEMTGESRNENGAAEPLFIKP
jgi:hypothetical protein